VAKYIRQASPYNTQIVALGIDTYLKMLLHDNFVVSQCSASTGQSCHIARCTEYARDMAGSTLLTLDVLQDCHPKR